MSSESNLVMLIQWKGHSCGPQVVLLVRLPTEAYTCVCSETHARIFSAALLVPERLQIPLSPHARENDSEFWHIHKWNSFCGSK